MQTHKVAREQTGGKRWHKRTTPSPELREGVKSLGGPAHLRASTIGRMCVSPILFHRDCVRTFFHISQILPCRQALFQTLFRHFFDPMTGAFARFRALERPRDSWTTPAHSGRLTRQFVTESPGQQACEAIHCCASYAFRFADATSFAFIHQRRHAVAFVSPLLPPVPSAFPAPRLQGS